MLPKIYTMREGAHVQSNTQHQSAMCTHPTSKQTAQIKDDTDIIQDGVLGCIHFMLVKRLISHAADIRRAAAAEASDGIRESSV